MKKILVLLLIVIVAHSCTSSRKMTPEVQPVSFQLMLTNPDGIGNRLEITFEKGSEHNHPLMAIWLEDTVGKYIQTLYVVQSIATSTFNFGEVHKGKWMPGVIRRPAALPYWSHKRGIKAPDGLYTPSADNPVPDAYSGATPEADFILTTRSDKELKRFVTILFEINQSWDWNEHWTNNKYPDDKEYKTSSQPALVYAAVIDTQNKGAVYSLSPVGHSHYSGKTGELFPDLTSITTAFKIAKSIRVKVISD
jgi:hypothetical protein